MSVKRYSVGVDGVDPNGNLVKYTDYAALEAKCSVLAAENAALKSVIAENWSMRDVLRRLVSARPGGVYFNKWEQVILKALNETPVTDAFLAEVRAQARNEGINYAAGRLAAAFNHGFVDKPLAEVCDVVHMILDTKEELAGSMIPAVDGLSGEYAEAFLEDSAAQLRKGVQQ